MPEPRAPAAQLPPTTEPAFADAPDLAAGGSRKSKLTALITSIAPVLIVVYLFSLVRAELNRMKQRLDSFMARVREQQNELSAPQVAPANVDAIRGPAEQAMMADFERFVGESAPKAAPPVAQPQGQGMMPPSMPTGPPPQMLPTPSHMPPDAPMGGLPMKQSARAPTSDSRTQGMSETAVFIASMQPSMMPPPPQAQLPRVEEISDSNQSPLMPPPGAA